MRNNTHIQIVYCEIELHKHLQRATALMSTAALVFLLEKSVNFALIFNTLSLLRVTFVTGAVSPVVDANQLLSINESVSCVFLCIAGGISTFRHRSACLSRAEPTGGLDVYRFRKKLVHLPSSFRVSVEQFVVQPQFYTCSNEPQDQAFVRQQSDVQLRHNSKTGVQCHSLSGWGLGLVLVEELSDPILPSNLVPAVHKANCLPMI